MIKIWERYFLNEVIKTTIFFLSCFYGLYVLIDYASHTGSFHRNQIHFKWDEVALYYVFDFIKHLDFLLPLALLIATIRTVCSLNTHNELVALMSSGISVRTLMLPFIFLGLFCTCLMYLNLEVFSPVAMRELKHIEDTRSSKKREAEALASVQHIILDDNSTLVFQSFDSSQNRFFDSYWIRNVDDIYRIKHLFPYVDHPDTSPVGHFIDHLKRNQQGELVTIESFDTKVFPELRFNKQALFETITPAEHLSMTELWKKSPGAFQLASEKQAQALTAFYQKIFLPWICLLVVIGPIPFCLKRTRHLPMFFIYAGSIFGLLAFDVLMEAAVVLGKRQVLSPLWAVWPPFFAISGLLCWRFSRLK